MATEINAVELMVRLVASLGMVVAIILVLAKVVRKRGGLSFGRTNGGPRLDVLDRTSLSRNASVAVVRVGGRGLIVGITDQSVTLLAEAPELIDRYEASSEQDNVTEHVTEQLTLEAERTAPPVERLTETMTSASAAPESTRMNFFEALRESTVRRS